MIYFVVLTLKCLIDELDHQLGPGVCMLYGRQKFKNSYICFYRIRLYTVVTSGFLTFYSFLFCRGSTYTLRIRLCRMKKIYIARIHYNIRE